MSRVAVGMLGLGTVGSGVARLVIEQADRIARRAGREVDLRYAVVRDRARVRNCPLPAERIVEDARLVVDDPEIAVVVEVMGGVDPAFDWVARALAHGKDVVTANKALLAERGSELFALARQHGRALSFEGAVGGGIPIIQALQVGLAANRVEAIAAIVNGTCNFILTAMGRDGLSYDEALTRAQALGFAEADPTLDVDGTDTAHKLAVLARLAFGVAATTSVIPRAGIDRLHPADLGYAAELGYVVKLLAMAERTEAGLVLRVAPSLVRRGTPLADVQGPYNAVRVVGDAVGDTLFYGQGAGSLPTASAVVGDLIDVLNGRAALTARALDRWLDTEPAPALAPPGRSRSRFYLRFTIADRPGVIAAIARVLGDHGISIASLIQHDPGAEATPATPVPLVMMTHQATEADLRQALAAIDRLDVVHPPTVCLGVAE